MGPWRQPGRFQKADICYTEPMKLPSAGRIPVVLGALLTLPSVSVPANRVDIQPQEFAKAIDQVDAFRKEKLSAADIRIVKCIRPDEEPTEFECTWLRRTNAGWIKHRTWLARDATGWHVID